MPVGRPPGPAPDTIDRLVPAVLACLREHGPEGTTISRIARASGLSRATIYTHFADRDAVLRYAMEDAALALSRRISRQLSGITDVGERIVEFVVVARHEFDADPVTAHMVEVGLLPRRERDGVMSVRVLDLLRPHVSGLAAPGAPAAELDELAETIARFVVSVLTYRSASTETDDQLRGYLRRRMLPALGLRTAHDAALGGER